MFITYQKNPLLLLTVGKPYFKYSVQLQKAQPFAKIVNLISRALAIRSFTHLLVTVNEPLQGLYGI